MFNRQSPLRINYFIVNNLILTGSDLLVAKICTAGFVSPDEEKQ